MKKIGSENGSASAAQGAVAWFLGSLAVLLFLFEHEADDACQHSCQVILMNDLG